MPLLLLPTAPGVTVTLYVKPGWYVVAGCPSSSSPWSPGRAAIASGSE